jgi:L-ribulokinase
MVRMHAPAASRRRALHARKSFLRIRSLRAEEGDFGAPHVLPDFHGNRSPLADPHAVGVISGLTLDTPSMGSAALYWRTCVAIALGVRHILEMMKEYGYVPDTLHVPAGM